MSVFDQYQDTPYQIAREGGEISIKFDRTGSTTATISWEIPRKSSGETSSLEPAYYGILITLDDSPTEVSKQPVNGTKYVADPTGDTNLHVGDRIGTALVVAMLFNDRTTTTVNVTNLDPDKVYFVTGHAVDKSMRYHTSGVHTYSTKYGNDSEPGKPAYHHIRVGAPEVGVLPTDATGLVLGETYTIDATVGEDTHTFSFLGDDVQTYQELLDQWNRQAKLVNNPLESPTIPNTGAYYYKASTQELMQWDGNEHNPVPVVVEAVAPNNPAVGTLWIHPDGFGNETGIRNTTLLSHVLEAREWDGTQWNPATVGQYSKDISKMECGYLLFGGTSESLVEWNGTVWVDKKFFPNNELVAQVPTDYYPEWYIAGNDPSQGITVHCGDYWFNETNDTLYVREDDCKWKQTIGIWWDKDPANPNIGDKWFDEVNNKLFDWTGSMWNELAVEVSAEQPQFPVIQFWYNPETMQLFEYVTSEYQERDVLLWEADPVNLPGGTLWWDNVNDKIYVYDTDNHITNTWVEANAFYIQPTDPADPIELEKDSIWITDAGTWFRWDGSEWHREDVLTVFDLPFDTNDQTRFDGVVYYDKVAKEFRRGTDMVGVWDQVEVLEMDIDPTNPATNSFWYDSTNNTLNQYNGASYTNVPFSKKPLTPSAGYQYFDTNLDELMEWNGYGWQNGEPELTVSLINNNQYLRFETKAVGSYAQIYLHDIEPVGEFYQAFEPSLHPFKPVRGSDGLSGQKSYAEVGIGNDGSDDERRELIDSIRHQLGYPTIDVELTKQQMNYAIDGAIESLRKRSGMAYKHGYKFMDIPPGQQHFLLTDKRNGFNSIVEVMAVHRVGSAFMSHAGGHGMYGQIALQQMFKMGSFDLVSYHLVSQYVETMEHLFATRLTYNWDEDYRKLSIYKQFFKPERVLLEVAVERTEQQLLKDRYLKGWIEKYATVQCRLMLAAIRGKFASLPGAGGGVSLDAGEQAARADAELMDLYEQIDDYIANNPEEYGMGSTFVVG